MKLSSQQPSNYEKRTQRPISPVWRVCGGLEFFTHEKKWKKDDFCGRRMYANYRKKRRFYGFFSPETGCKRPQTVATTVIGCLQSIALGCATVWGEKKGCCREKSRNSSFEVRQKVTKNRCIIHETLVPATSTYEKRTQRSISPIWRGFGAVWSSLDMKKSEKNTIFWGGVCATHHRKSDLFSLVFQPEVATNGCKW